VAKIGDTGQFVRHQARIQAFMPESGLSFGYRLSGVGKIQEIA
jgi:hypothetical protein